MGLGRGIFTVDTHVHAQRMAAKVKENNVKDYGNLFTTMQALPDAYDNSGRILYHMDRYGVDVAVIMPAFAMTNDLNVDLVKRYPDRFVSLCRDVRTAYKAKTGEKEWNIKDCVQEIDEALSTGMFVGIGEMMPSGGFISKNSTLPSWNERFDQICQIMELCRKYKVVATYHAGFPSGYAGSGEGAKLQGHMESDAANPLLAIEVAAAYPDVPIILQHGGIEGSGYRTDIYEKCLIVARTCRNVYLECGMWWAELYERPLKDPNIGCEKLVWGTDFGASSTPQSWMPGCVPETFANQDINAGIPAHQIDIYGWSLREIGRLNIPQDDLNLVLGGNACRLFKIKTPFTRLFKEYIKA